MWPSLYVQISMDCIKPHYLKKIKYTLKLVRKNAIFPFRILILLALKQMKPNTNFLVFIP